MCGSNRNKRIPRILRRHLVRVTVFSYITFWSLQLVTRQDSRRLCFANVWVWILNNFWIKVCLLCKCPMTHFHKAPICKWNYSICSVIKHKNDTTVFMNFAVSNTWGEWRSLFPFTWYAAVKKTSIVSRERNAASFRWRTNTSLISATNRIFYS